MFANLLTRLGFTRDMPMWLWLRVLSAATLLLSLSSDQIHNGLTFVGVSIPDLWIHRLLAIAVGVLWIAGKQDQSALRSTTEQLSVSLPVHNNKESSQ